MRKIKNALILAGGDSTRFWPLEEKAFFSFLGKPLILYQIEELSRYAETVVIVANKNNAVAIKRLIDNFEDDKKKYHVIIQKDSLPGQAGAILSVKNFLKGEVLIVNANDILDYTIVKETIKKAEKNQIIIVGKRKNEYFPGGYLRFNNKRQIVEVVEKPQKDKLPSSIVKLVLDYFSNIEDLITAIESEKTEEDNLYELAINSLLSTNINREFINYDNYWQSLKYPWHVLTMMKGFLTRVKGLEIAKTSTVSKNSLIIPPVFIGDNVRIGDYVKVVGPCYIGNNTVVGDHSLIRESQINDDCLIGSYTEVARSYIGNDVFLHRNYIGDSVISDETMLGAGTVTANFRFNENSITSVVDEEKVDTNLSKLGTMIGSQSKIGVSATILPGVKIGKKCLVGPNETVRYDLEDKTFLVRGEERENLNI